MVVIFNQNLLWQKKGIRLEKRSSIKFDLAWLGDSNLVIWCQLRVVVHGLSPQLLGSSHQYYHWNKKKTWIIWALSCFHKVTLLMIILLLNIFCFVSKSKHPSFYNDSRNCKFIGIPQVSDVLIKCNWQCTYISGP